MDSSKVKEALSKLDGAYVTVPKSFADLLQQLAGGKAQLILKIDSEGKCKEKFSAQNIVIEHNQSPESLVETALENAKRTKANVEGESEDEHPTAKRSKLDGDEANRAMLLSLVWTFKKTGGLFKDMCQTLTEKAADQGAVCEHTLENLEKQIIDGKITNLLQFFQQCRLIVTLYITTDTSTKILPQALKLLQAFKEASAFQETISYPISEK